MSTLFKTFLTISLKFRFETILFLSGYFVGILHFLWFCAIIIGCIHRNYIKVCTPLQMHHIQLR